MQKKLRVGFDLDGVLLYNPARIARPIVAYVKKRFLKTKKTQFFIPHTKLQNFIWRIFHYSSLFPNPGINEIRKLVKDGRIEAYVISGRYAFLTHDFEGWLKRINAEETFVKAVHNSKDQQPFIFKAHVIRDLDLDVFIEDNWDIVAYLNSKFEIRNSKCKVYWIYNILDRGIAYPHKFPTLKKAVEYIKNSEV